jgi:hypothetical protein
VGRSVHHRRSRWQRRNHGALASSGSTSAVTLNPIVAGDGSFIPGEPQIRAMDRQKVIALLFAFLMVMWMVATAATLL